MREGERGVVVLLFGKPAYNEETQSYGTILLSRRIFTSTVDISRSAELWMDGFWRCTLPNGPKITLAIGTSNFDLTPDLAPGHAQAWAAMVHDVADYITYKHYDKQISVAAASNIELQWSTPEAARSWVDNYTEVALHRLYIVGDCSGCPYANHPDRLPDNNWTQEDIWHISWGAVRSYPIPEIYNPDGTSASQWQFIARWGVDNKQHLMLFSGAITQLQACIDRGDACDGMNNPPEQAWKQFWDALNRDRATAQNPDFLTDIRWDY